MLDALRLYGRYVGVSLRAQMQYPASFIMLSTGQLLVTAIEFLGIWALFARFGSLCEWTLPEVALFYGMVHVAFALSEAVARGFDVFPGMVRNGEFDRVLLRPRTTALQIGAQHLYLTRIGRLSQGLAILLYGAWALGVPWSLAKAGLLVASVLGGACLFSGLFVLQATASFWTIESLEIVNCVTYGGVEAAQFPVTIFRPWFRRLFTFLLPLATINYFPAHAIIGRPEPLGSPVLFQWLTPVFGVVFLAATLQIWRVGVRHYRSTGS